MLHINDVDIEKKGNIKDCEKCEKIGSRWVRLRLFNIWLRRIL